EANALYPKGAGLEAALKEAEQQCDELAKVSPTKAAVLQVNLVRMDVGLGRAQPDDVAEVLKRGLDSDRPEDGPFRVALLVDRSSYYLKLKTPDPDKAYKDALAAVILAGKVNVLPATRAHALANAGMARYGQALKSDKQVAYYDEAIERLSEAVRIGPDHYAAWIWKAYLAHTWS